MKTISFWSFLFLCLAGSAWADSLLAPGATLAMTAAAQPTSTPMAASASTLTPAGIPATTPPATPQPIEKVEVQKKFKSEYYDPNLGPQTVNGYLTQTEYTYLGREVHDLNQLKPVLYAVHDPEVDQYLEQHDEESAWGWGLAGGGLALGTGGGLLIGLPPSSPTHNGLGAAALVVGIGAFLYGLADLGDSGDKLPSAIERYDKVVQGASPVPEEVKSGVPAGAEGSSVPMQSPPITYESGFMGTDFYHLGKKIASFEELKSVIQPIQSTEADGLLEESAEDVEAATKLLAGAGVALLGSCVLIATDPDLGQGGNDIRLDIGLGLLLAGGVVGYMGDDHIHGADDKKTQAADIYNEYYHWPPPSESRNPYAPVGFRTDLLAFCF